MPFRLNPSAIFRPLPRNLLFTVNTRATGPRDRSFQIINCGCLALIIHLCRYRCLSVFFPDISSIVFEGLVFSKYDVEIEVVLLFFETFLAGVCFNFRFIFFVFIVSIDVADDKLYEFKGHRNLKFKNHT